MPKYRDWDRQDREQQDRKRHRPRDRWEDDYNEEPLQKRNKKRPDRTQKRSG